MRYAALQIAPRRTVWKRRMDRGTIGSPLNRTGRLRFGRDYFAGGVLLPNSVIPNPIMILQHGLANPLAWLMTILLMVVWLVAGTQSARADCPGLGCFCERDAHCLSDNCADGKRCAPRDRTGISGNYCHHNNHCQSGYCSCAKGIFGFCKNWEQWPAGKFNASDRRIMIGFCK